MKTFLIVMVLTSLLTACTEANKKLLMYSSSDSGSTWTSALVEVTDTTTDSVVDPSPILMPDGSILLYYLAANGTDDPFVSQPDGVWRMAVAKSTDNGLNFSQQGFVYVSATAVTDPFPLRLADNTIRLLMNSASLTTVSTRSTGTDGILFATAADAGTRSQNISVPGGLLIGGTHFLYGCGSGGLSFETSADGLNFSVGGNVFAPTPGMIDCDPSPAFDSNSGNFIMAYKQKVATSDDPKDDRVRWATSPDGITWTDQAEVGAGSVPGLVIDQNGVWRIYVPNL